jgi:hypothetical protein
MKVAFVVIAIGDKYLEHYNSIFRPSHEAYTKKCGYDFKVITDYLDKSLCNKKVISFNKVLVCSQEWSSTYDYIIVVDADILINPKSPPLHSAYVYGDKIGIVDEFSQPTLAKRIEIQKRNKFEESATEYYKLYTHNNIITDSVLNTGLMVLQPSKHKNLLEYIYNKYSKLAIYNLDEHYHFEQGSVGYEIQLADAHIIIDNKWNAIWCIQSAIGDISLNDYVNQNYFTHFVGGLFHEYISGLTYL